MAGYDVVALGELLVDFTTFGESDRANPLFEANPGGAPCNVLAMLQKLGKKTAFMGKVGEDFFGQMLKTAVSEQGIDITNLLTDRETPTTLAFVHTAPDGDRSFSFYRNPGADMMFQEQELDVSLLEHTKIFHFGSLSMTEPSIEQTTKKAVSAAKKAGAIISFDPNLRLSLWDSPDRAKEKIAYGIRQCDILKISDDEVTFFADTQDIEEGTAWIRDRYHIPLLCVTMGKNGSVAYYHNRKVECAPFINKNTVETTGAGDTFMACILNGVLENGLEELNEEKLLEILRFANGAASLITTKKGALKVMPAKEEVTAFLQHFSRS
jgi:fructokinase